MSKWLLGVEIPPSTQVGIGLRLEHPTGIVVNGYTRIGRHCTIKQNVTLGVRGRLLPIEDCPELEDGVVVGAGAIVIGHVLIGEGAAIGAGSVVTKAVPRGARVVGNPAREIEGYVSSNN